MPRRRESPIFSAVPEKVEKAARAISARLRRAGIPHALVGGLAVNAYAEPRATRDVDFLVPVEARAVLGGKPLAASVSGVTIRVGGVNVDLLFPEKGERFLEEAVRQPRMIDRMPVAFPEVMVYLKMTAVRGARDENDILNMLRAGLNPGKVELYLRKHARDLLEDFRQLVAIASLE
ncbi:MAG: hypothetical protein RDV41_05450 [Planctomycetota bacterium]|nr:hypothetical protein [Planctomycetota bacterium]